MSPKSDRIARLRRLDRQLRRRSGATSKRETVPRVETGKTFAVGVPLVVGSVLYGQLCVFNEVHTRSGFDAYRFALRVDFRDAEVASDFQQSVRRLGVEQFAASWHLLVAFVDQVGVEPAIEQLGEGLLYPRRRADS